MDVIVYGTITKTIPAKQTVHLQKDGFEAVISQNWNGDKVTRLVLLLAYTSEGYI